MGTVVVGYVAKPEGEAALARAIVETRLRDTRLVVVTSHSGDDFDSDAVDKAETEISAVRTQLDEAGLSYDVRQMIRGMEPAEDVVSVAQESEAELIVIGLRRRSPVGKLILGSQAQRILLDAPCPVLAVKAKG